MGDLDNYQDGSDRQIIRAVAAACGWQLMRISETSDYYVRVVGAEQEDHGTPISIQCDYWQERGDVYTRALKNAALRSDAGTHSMWNRLPDTIEMLRSHQRTAWRMRMDRARLAQVQELQNDINGGTR